MIHFFDEAFECIQKSVEKEKLAKQQYFLSFSNWVLAIFSN